ncbi:neutral/alkaline non-lysosomal ceramidase N-terminal domain-containing protein [Fredinandcohnia salidurans]|uniref:Neutral/alkaline non-lysosomal ceramidase N-terminal domain-containing protein n=1 Tax=Fredinandcohnia salidurans TaxID=2595041 RepID=A0ABW4MRP0_9BACI
MTLLLGTYEIDMTPRLPVQLAGFAHREGKAMEVHSPLFLKTYYFEQNGKPFLLFIGDVIWWDDQLVNTWRKRVADEYSVKVASICFHSTHNHSGPQTSDAFTSLLGVRDQSFIESLEDIILKSVKCAITNKEPVTIVRRKTSSDIGVYRRLQYENKMVMSPNPSVPIDKEVTIITFENRKQDMKAMLIHHACHPTSTDANVVSSEYTGVCCARLKETYQHAVIGFLQGCCGDVRPALIKDHTFFRGSLQDMEAIGNQLAEDIISGINISDAEMIHSDRLEAYSSQVPLPFQEEYTVNEEMEPEVIRIWKQHIEQNWQDKNKTQLEIQYLDISSRLRFIFFNGEMVQHYSQYVKKIDSGVLALGYSNGMIGYIPSQTQLMEGGYEAEEFIYYFGLPAPFHIKTEKIIKNAIDNILEGE